MLHTVVDVGANPWIIALRVTFLSVPELKLKFKSITLLYSPLLFTCRCLFHLGPFTVADPDTVRRNLSAD